MNNYIFTLSSIILYLVCSALLFSNLNKNSSANNLLPKKVVIAIGLAAVTLHALALHSSMYSPMGIDLGFYNALSLISAFIALFILVATWRHPVDVLSVILLPAAALMLVLQFLGNSSHLLPAGSSNTLIFHILASIVAYSLLALAALQAVLLSIQSKLLHAHQPGGFVKLLPALKEMEVLLFEVIFIGFIALTISLGSGLIFLENMFAQHLAHKTILSIFAWLVFLILIIGNWKLGWRGRTAIRWTLSGFFSLMLAYFGSKFVLEVLLT